MEKLFFNLFFYCYFFFIVFYILRGFKDLLFFRLSPFSGQSRNSKIDFWNCQKLSVFSDIRLTYAFVRTTMMKFYKVILSIFQHFILLLTNFSHFYFSSQHLFNSKFYIILSPIMSSITFYLVIFKEYFNTNINWNKFLFKFLFFIIYKKMYY